MHCNSFLLESIILLVREILSTPKFRVAKVKNNAMNIIGVLPCPVFSWVALRLAAGNLCISVRQNWMFVPILIFLLISMTKNRKEVGGNIGYKYRIFRHGGSTINK